MAKGARAYRGEKRRKELSRQKKQEEKRQRRFKKGVDTEPDAEEIGPEGTDAKQED